MPPVAAALPVISTIASVAGTIKGLTAKTPKAPSAPAVPTPAPFVPKKPDAMARPSSAAALGSYDPTQERTALATKGVSGGGLGKEEDQYYKNLVQRSLIGDNNKVSGSLNTLMPVESQYFSGQGVNTSDINEFLRMIQGGGQ